MKKLLLLLLALLPVACVPPPTMEKCQVATMAGPGGVSGNQFMSVVKDSQGCNIRFTTYGGPYTTINLRKAPEHGTVHVWNREDGSLARYTPAPGYVGHDTFLVSLGSSFAGNVSVDVLP